MMSTGEQAHPHHKKQACQARAAAEFPASSVWCPYHPNTYQLKWRLLSVTDGAQSFMHFPDSCAAHLAQAVGDDVPILVLH